jgi:hypothetical protein
METEWKPEASRDSVTKTPFPEIAGGSEQPEITRETTKAMAER